MKIVVDCRMSGKSGIGTFLDEILPYFATSQNEFLFLGMPQKKQSEFSSFNNIRFEDCNYSCFSIKEIFLFPKKLIKKINEYDIYFSPYCNIPSNLFAKIKIPVYTTIHDVVFLDIPDLAGKTGTFIRKCFYKRATKKSSHIFTVSEFSKSRIIKHLKTKKSISVVYNGLPQYIEEFNPENVQQKENKLIFIGNIKKHKGLSVLLTAYKDFLTKINQKATLMIIGAQDNFRTSDETIKKQIDSINKIHPEAIQFTGFISNQELLTLLAKSKILVQPSLYEGFGIPPLQALHCKTNAVISDIEVFKEIYKDHPVTFFENQNSADLTDKLLKEWNTPTSLDNIPQIYSYKNTADLILKEFCNKA